MERRGEEGMMTRMVLFGFVTMLLGWPLLHPAWSAAAGNPTNGKILYETHCLACHGPQGRGDGPGGQALNPRPADLTMAGTQNKRDVQLLKIIENGRPASAMTGFKGRLSEHEMSDLVVYLRQLGK